MRILLFENNEGFSSYSHKLANAMINIGDNIELHYLTPTDNKYLDKIDGKVVVKPELSPYPVIYKKNSFKWFIDRMRITLNNISLREEYVSKYNPDAIVIQNTMPVVDQYFIGRLKKSTKIVITVHDVIPPIVSKNWSIKSLSRIYNIADTLIVHTDENKKQLIEEFRIDESKIQVIHHGVEIKYDKVDKKETLKKLGIDNDMPVILFYGLIREQKGLDNLIQSLNNQKCNLIIAGALPTGESFEKYEQLLSNANIHDIRMIEYISEEVTNELFQISDIVALPYKYFYSQSGVFMQAIQYHVPIVASDVSGFKSYIDKYKIGYICKPNDVLSLRKALEVLIEDQSKLEECKRNMDLAAFENSWESSAKLYLKVLEKKDS